MTTNTPPESNPAATKAPSSASSSGDQGSSSRPSLASAGSTNPTPPEVGLAVGGGPSRDPVREALIEWETFAMKTIYGLEPGDPLRQGMERLHGPRLARTRAALSQARTNTNEKAGGDCGKAGGEGSLIGVVPTHRASSSPGVSASVDAPITADVVTPPATFTAAELLREVVDAVLDGETTSTYMNEDDWLDEGFRRLARALTAAREYLDKAESQSNASRDVGSVSTSASSCDSAASLLATDPTFRQCCSPGSEYRAATRAVAILKPGRASEILRDVVDEVDSLLSVTPDPPALKAAREHLDTLHKLDLAMDMRRDAPQPVWGEPSRRAALGVGLWRCENCGEAYDPCSQFWRDEGRYPAHKCPESHPQSGHFPARWFGDGPPVPPSKMHPIAESAPRSTEAVEAQTRQDGYDSSVPSRVQRINDLLKRAVQGALVPCARESESPDILDKHGKRLLMAFWGTHPPTPEATAAEEDRIYSTLEALCGMWNVWPRLMKETAPVDREAGGRAVRAAWTAYCRETGHTQRENLYGWDDLTAWQREASMRMWDAAWNSRPARSMATVEQVMQRLREELSPSAVIQEWVEKTLQEVLK